MRGVGSVWGLLHPDSQLFSISWSIKLLSSTTHIHIKYTLPLTPSLAFYPNVPSISNGSQTPHIHGLHNRLDRHPRRRNPSGPMHARRRTRAPPKTSRRPSLLRRRPYREPERCDRVSARRRRPECSGDNEGHVYFFSEYPGYPACRDWRGGAC